MRLLKFFLWITLLACIAWGAAIFLGPTVISRAVATYFGDAVKVKRLDVSPALEVSAAAVEFDFPARDGAPAVRGVARGVTLDWKCPTPPPHLNFDDEPKVVHEVYDYSTLDYESLQRDAT